MKDDLKIYRRTHHGCCFRYDSFYSLYLYPHSLTTHYFKYYIGEQSSPLLTHIYNFVLAYVINPIYGLFGGQASALIDDAHRYGYEVLTSIFNTLRQGISLVGVSSCHGITKIVGKRGSVLILFVTALICTGSFSI